MAEIVKGYIHVFVFILEYYSTHRKRQVYHRYSENKFDSLSQMLMLIIQVKKTLISE